MACGPNRAPGRCEVPPSNGAPMIMMSVPAHDGGSDRSAAGTPRKVASGPYRLPIRVIAPLRCLTLATAVGSSRRSHGVAVHRDYCADRIVTFALTQCVPGRG